MKQKFVRAFGDVQELFQELVSAGVITEDQATRFNNAQKTIVNFYEWVNAQLNPVLKVELPWNDQVFVDAWLLWKKFKTEKNFIYKPIGEQSALKKLTDISGGDMHRAIAILKQSRENGWSGLFPLKEESSQKVVLQNIEHKQDIFNRLTNPK